MSDPKIVASSKQAVHRSQGPGESSLSWFTLGWIGLAFLLVGGLDFVLVWFPLAIGTPEWEFATVTQAFNGLPILLLGIGLLLVASERVERGWWAMLAGGSAAVLFLWVLAGFGLWVLNVGLAMNTVPDEVRFGVVKAITKTAVQAGVYSVAMGYLTVRAWGAMRGGGSGES